MENENRTKTILKAYEEWDYEYVDLLYDEYHREHAQLSGEIQGIIEVSKEFANDKLMLWIMQAHVNMMSEHIWQLLAIKREVSKIIGKKL